MSLRLLTACNKGSSLPGGYAIFSADSEDVGLVLPPKGKILVGPKLAKIGNSGTLIFGKYKPLDTGFNHRKLGIVPKPVTAYE